MWIPDTVKFYEFDRNGRLQKFKQDKKEACAIIFFLIFSVLNLP